MVKDYIKLLRPHQYVKNLFIFLPIFFSMNFTHFALVVKAIIAFIAFSLAASSVYIFNDYFDIADDRLHPVKKDRPLASGRITVPSAFAVMAIMLIASVLIASILKINILILLCIYIITNILYTIKLKHIPLLDIAIIASFFVIRIFVGNELINVPISMWIVLMTFLLALFLAMAKRRDDLLIYKNSGNKVRSVVDGYNLEFINISMMIMASVTIVSYIMYTISPDVISRLKSDKLYLTVILVILGILRYMQISFVDEKSGSPTMVLLKDRFLQIVILMWILSFVLILYIQ